MIESLQKFLRDNQQIDGGFGYYKADKSFAEPTAYCALALNSILDKSDSAKRSVNWFLKSQNLDGGWPLFLGDKESSPVATAFALITLNTVDNKAYKSQIEKGKVYLEKINAFITNKDMDEKAWGWDKGCFISIEATAYIVYSLKATNSDCKKRIEEGEKFFIENPCDCGGWTYGYPIDTNHPESKTVYYTPLVPQLHITALVLLALQKHNIDTQKHIKYIYDNYKQSHCPMSLSLAVLALNCYKHKTLGILNYLNAIMKYDNDVTQMPYYVGLTILANLTRNGKNPLCLNR